MKSFILGFLMLMVAVTGVYSLSEASTKLINVTLNGPAPAVGDSFILMADGSSFIVLDDGTSKIIL